MTQAFQTFCQEPDPLRPNNVVFQQLANSEAAHFFDNSAFAGPGMGMGMQAGFNIVQAGDGAAFGFGISVGDENEGINEAGQILQALARDQQQQQHRVSVGGSVSRGSRESGNI